MFGPAAYVAATARHVTRPAFKCAECGVSATFPASTPAGQLDLAKRQHIAEEHPGRTDMRSVEIKPGRQGHPFG